MNQPVPAKFQGYSAMLKKWNFDTSELVGFFALSQSKVITFQNFMFQNFSFGNTSKSEIVWWYLAAWEGKKLLPVSVSWEKLPKSSVATPGFLNCAACRRRGLIWAMTLGLFDSDFGVRTPRAENWSGTVKVLKLCQIHKALVAPRHYLNEGKWVHTIIKSILECQLPFQGIISSTEFFFMTFPYG